MDNFNFTYITYLVNNIFLEEGRGTDKEGKGRL